MSIPSKTTIANWTISRLISGKDRLAVDLEDGIDESREHWDARRYSHE